MDMSQRAVAAPLLQKKGATEEDKKGAMEWKATGQVAWRARGGWCRWTCRGELPPLLFFKAHGKQGPFEGRCRGRACRGELPPFVAS